MARPLVIPILGNTSDLEAAMARAGVVAEDASKKITGSFRSAGLAAAEEAKKLGASVDEQAAAAGRAAAAFTAMSEKITTAQRNAGKAAATAASQVGASVDEQRAAYLKAIAVQSDYEAAQKRAADSAKAAAAEQAASAKKAADAAEAAQKKIASFGKWSLAGGLGVAAFSVKGAIDLQQQMEQLHTQAGATQAQVQSMTKAVMNMAGPLATSPTALADSLYHAFSATKNETVALNIMSAAAKEAKVSGADLTDTTTALTAAVFSGIQGAQNFNSAMGTLNATVGAGDMKFQDLNEAFAGPMLATVKGYGLSLHDVGAALATFGDLNIRGADAATQLRMAVQYMAKPAATAGPLLEKLGLNTHSFADAMAKGGLLPALQLLHDKLSAAGIQGNQMAQVIGDLFTKKGAAGVTILENALDRVKSKYQQVGDGAKQQNAAWEGYNKTLAADIDHLKATVQGLADKFGTYLIPKLQAAGQAIQSVIAWMQKHKSAAQDLAIAIGTILGGAIVVYTATKAVAFITATGNMAKAIGVFASNIASIVPRIAAKFGLIGSSAEASAAEVKAADAGIVASADTTAAGVDSALGSTGIGLVIVGLGVAATEMATHWSSVMDAMKSAVNTMVQAAESDLNELIGVLNDAIGVFNSTIGQLTGQIGSIGSVGTGGVFGSGGNMFDTAHGLAPYQAPSFSTSSGGPVPVPTSGSNAQRIAGALAAQGFSKTAIAGILGNFAQETGGGTLSGINTRDSGTGASGMGGMGIAQWTAGRRQQEMSYAAIHHESPTSLAAQVGFLVQELRTNYHGAYNAIAGAKTPQQAAQLFNKLFEGGTDPNGIRESVAAQAFAWLTGKSPGASSSSGGLSTAQLDSLLNSTGTKAKSVKTLLYANPFPGGATQGRTDMGVDFSAAPGSPVDAIGAGVVKAIINNWYKGQPLIEEQLTQGPNKGKYVYYAEQIQSLVHLGQQVQAGQRIGTVAPSGTGLELGFGAPGGRTLAQATTGYVEGEQTPAGKAFAAFLKAIGTNGIYQTTSASGIVSGGGTNYGSMIAQAVQAFIQSLDKASNALIQSYQTLEQSGTVRTLTRALGVNTGGAYGTGTYYNGPSSITGGVGAAGIAGLGVTTGTQSVASALYNAIESISTTKLQNELNAGNNPTQLDKTLIPILKKASANSQATKNFNTLVAELRASGQTGQANALISARGGVLATLAQEMYAQQILKDSESIQLQATQEKDQTTLAQDTAAKQLQIAKDSSQQVVDQVTEMATQVKDQTQIITDTFQSIATQISDATQAMADSANAAVQGINDQTQTQVDILGERGLYGLNLIAQRQQVQLDQMKASYDQQIAAAQAQLDATKQTWDAAVSNAQLSLDQVQLQQDTLVSQQQQALDTVQLAQDTKIAAAQAHVDSVTLAQDVAVQLAQSVVDLSANAPKAQQDIANAQLKKATSQSSLSIAGAQSNLTSVSDAATAAINAASSSFNQAQATATLMIGNAQEVLATVQGQAQQQINLAQQNLQSIQDTASIAEATQQGLVNVTQATAQTQFAGTGTTVNVYGIPAENAAAIADAVGWVSRTQLQTA